MAYTLEVNHPEFPKGFEFDCDGILVENGSSTKITAEQEQQFPGRSGGLSVKEIYGKSPDHIKLSGTTELSGKSGGGE